MLAPDLGRRRDVRAVVERAGLHRDDALALDERDFILPYDVVNNNTSYDGTEYTVRGERLPNFHMISHRIYSHGSEGDPIAGAAEMHHDIDRLHLATFRHMLDRLDEYGILDQTVAVWTNDLASGPPHSYSNLPVVIVGGNGFLKNGEYVHAGGVTNNKLWNTVINAAGVRGSGGDDDFITDFGDPSLSPGLISQMLA